VLADSYLINPAGTVPSYSNLGFALLGHILPEYVVTGATLESLTAELITGPLGMVDTGKCGQIDQRTSHTKPRTLDRPGFEKLQIKSVA
jgi:CubicO group peptidase (beta-lactamase class C family)